MRTWKMIPLTALLAATVFGCSARPIDLTEGVPQSASRVARLEKAFQNREISRTDKMRVAAELVRLGVRKPVYRDYIEDQVERALDAEQRAAAAWDDRGNHPPDAAIRRRPVAMNVSTRTVVGGTLEPEPAAGIRPPDATNLLPVVMRSMTATEGDETARDQLRRALKSGNVLLSAEAALGLAKLKDKESIRDIADAAVRFDQVFLFGRALLYYGDPTADAIAKDLLQDDALVRDIQNTAKLRKYDPYYRK
jgi:hypothetical protein